MGGYSPHLTGPPGADGGSENVHRETTSLNVIGRRDTPEIRRPRTACVSPGSRRGIGPGLGPGAGLSLWQSRNCQYDRWGSRCDNLS